MIGQYLTAWLFFWKHNMRIFTTTICLLVSKMGIDTHERSWESRLCCRTARKVITSVSNCISLKTNLWLESVTFKGLGLKMSLKINTDSVTTSREIILDTREHRDAISLKFEEPFPFWALEQWFNCLGKLLLHYTVQAVLAELPSFWMHAFEIIIMIMWIPSNLTVI